jgi:hypothetical protein
MKKYNTLNEEIKRMVSMFGNELIHGNLLETMEKKDKKLINEQWVPLINLFSDFIQKGSRYDNLSKIYRQSDNVTFNFKKLADGTMEVLKNGKKIDVTNIKNILSDRIIKKIDNQIKTLTKTEDDFNKFLSGTDESGITLKSMVNDIIDDLAESEFIEVGTSAEIKKLLKDSGVFETLDNIFKNPDQRDQFLKSIRSDATFKQDYPEFYDIFTSVPTLKKEFLRVYKDGSKYGDYVSDTYDSLIGLSKKLKSLEFEAAPNVYNRPLKNYFDKNGNLNITDNITLGDGKGEITLIPTKNVGWMNDMEQGGSSMANRLEKDIKELNDTHPEVDISLNRETGEIKIRYNREDLLPKDRKALDDLNNPSKTNVGKEFVDDVGEIDPIEINVRRADTENTNKIMDMEDITSGEKVRDEWTTYDDYDQLLPYKMAWKNVISQPIRITLSKIKQSPVYQEMMGILTNRLSNSLDYNFLQKNGYKYVKGSTTTTGKVINDQWADFLSNIYKYNGDCPNCNKESIFIENEADELFFGKSIGEFKTNLVKKDNWKTYVKNELYKGVTVPMTKDFKLLKQTMGMENPLKEVRAAADKYYRRFIVLPANALGLWVIYKSIFYIIGWVWWDTAVEKLKQSKELVIDIFQGTPMNPNIILPMVQNSFKIKCRKSVKDAFNQSFGESGAAKYDIVFDKDNTAKQVWDFEVDPKDPSKWKDGEWEKFNNTTNLPYVTNLRYAIEQNTINGLSFKDVGQFKVEEKKLFFITVPVEIDGKQIRKKINIRDCDKHPFDDDTNGFWITQWKEKWELHQDENKLMDYIEKNMKDFIKNVDEKTDESDILDQIFKTTVDDVTNRVEDVLETVKEKGEELRDKYDDVRNDSAEDESSFGTFD